MRKIKYPSAEVMALEEAAYKKIFESHFIKYQSKWVVLRDKLRGLSANSQMYRDNADDYLCMPFAQLAEMYLDYIRFSSKLSDAEKSELTAIFNYGGYQPQIAYYFMDRAETFGLNVCHYCEMSYVNMYGFDTTYPSVAKMLMEADEGELRDYIRKKDGGQYAAGRYKGILALRKSHTLADIVTEFDKKFKGKTKKSKQVQLAKFNHFDLDHFLPKGECPIVGLSLYNFVPSCSVCNEKLKRSKLPGGDLTKILKLSPTSYDYNFDGEMSVQIVPGNGANLLRMSQTPNMCRLVFSPDSSVYQEEVRLFRLSARYNYHKAKALSLHDKLMDYPTSMIEKIETLLGGARTKDEIEKDLYGTGEENDIFDKMKRDLLEVYKK